MKAIAFVVNISFVNIQGGRLALGPFRLSKNSEWLPVLASFFRTKWTPLEGPGDRNFDAGPSRDLNFDALSWLEPCFFGGQKDHRSEGFPRTRTTKRSCACDCGRGPVSVGAFFFFLLLSLFISFFLSFFLSPRFVP